MSHVIELTDEQFAAIEAAAREQGVTPAAYVTMVAKTVGKPGVVYDDADEFSRSLGDTEEEIAEAKAHTNDYFPPDSESN